MHVIYTKRVKLLVVLVTTFRAIPCRVSDDFLVLALAARCDCLLKERSSGAEALQQPECS